MKLKIKPGVDLEFAFELLKRNLETAEEKFNDTTDEYRAASAYGTLKGGAEMIVDYCTIQEPENDIPETLFQSPKAN